MSSKPDRDPDRGIRRGTTAAVLLVAVVAAVVSYIHIEHESARYGQDILAALLMPLSIDGTVAAASLVMLRAARLGQPVPWLGRAMLALAVLATLAANVGYGAAHGVPGALISGWPAIAFVGSVELAVTMVRRTRAAEPGKRAIEAYQSSLAAGVPLSERAISGQFGISRRQAAKVRATVNAGSNGHGPGVS